MSGHCGENLRFLDYRRPRLLQKRKASADLVKIFENFALRKYMQVINK